MNQELILYPAFAMALLTFAVGLALFLHRVRAVKRGLITPGYFLLNRGGRQPDELIRFEQNYSNLFELPVLFYALAALLYATQHADLIQLALLWAFVLSRLLHTLIHVTINHLIWRMRSFFAGFYLLLGGWLLLLFRLVQGG